jgi:hypothetical protein
MQPFRDIDLGMILSSNRQKMAEKVDSFTNEEIMANDLEILASNLYEVFRIEPVEITDEEFGKRHIEQAKIKKRIDPFFRDYYEKEYVEVDGVIMTFYFPFTGWGELFKCHASMFACGGYPDITVGMMYISFVYEYSLEEVQGENARDKALKKLERDIKDIRDGISYANKDVESYNMSLKKQALQLLEEKKRKVESFFLVANMFEVPVKKSAYAETHVPLQRKIVPIAHEYKKEDIYSISDANYADILATIKHMGSTYERTPKSYAAMKEEDLRNTLLAALNGTYLGGAVGEAFRNNGKTDICIEEKNRAAFVAECKMWTGQKAIADALKQLDSYLTWRDCKTALIYFVRKKDFLAILQTAEEALRAIPEMRQVQVLDKNEFKCCMVSTQNPGQQIQVRVMLFNMYAKE